MEPAKAKAKGNFIFLQGQLGLMDYNDLLSLLTDVDVVYHLAADATEGRSQFTPWRCTSDGLLASNQIFAAACQAKVKRIVFTSSMAIYGEGQPPFKEYDTPAPSDIYGWNKYAAEESLKILAKLHGVEYTILRPHNVFGPRQNMADPYRNLVAIWLNSYLSGKKCFIYGRGTQTRQFTYIQDLIPLLDIAGYARETKNSTFNVGSSKEWSLNELAHFIAILLDREDGEMFSDLPARPLDVERAVSDNSLWGMVTGTKMIETPLQVALEKTIRWAEEHGPEHPQYMPLEIDNEQVPVVWKERMI
jgi:UDP-glucose 4-epimerase